MLYIIVCSMLCSNVVCGANGGKKYADGGVKAAKKFPRSRLGPTRMGTRMVSVLLRMTTTSCLMAV